MHQTGGFGSTGYQYEFSEEETRKNVLRTHTTAVSSRMLYAAAQDAMKTGEFQPKKYFSIDRVFRNENLDKTHLAEFHQIEGRERAVPCAVPCCLPCRVLCYAVLCPACAVLCYAVCCVVLCCAMPCCLLC